MDRDRWPEMKAAPRREIFATKTRDEWCEIMEGTDICFAPVLTMDEAAQHPHNVERSTFVEVAGLTQPAPAPRFDRTPADGPATAGVHRSAHRRDPGGVARCRRRAHRAMRAAPSPERGLDAGLTPALSVPVSDGR